MANQTFMMRNPNIPKVLLYSERHKRKKYKQKRIDRGERPLPPFIVALSYFSPIKRAIPADFG